MIIMKSKIKTWTQNKKILKWTFNSFIALVLGLSIITNITYLPQYFYLKNHNDRTYRVQIIAIDDSKLNDLKVIDINYETSYSLCFLSNYGK